MLKKLRAAARSLLPSARRPSLSVSETGGGDPAERYRQCGVDDPDCAARGHRFDPERAARSVC